ncbi:MAG: electron transport complex subunit RsxG [Oleiphilaceae bacterium]|nr:electron transport complex subunit RsxG [Oleiphilaceae bacterium]
MPSAMMRTILGNAFGLALFALFTAGLIALTQSATQERIQQQQREARAGALREILPSEQHDNALLEDRFTLPDDPRLGHKAPAEGWRARRDGRVTAVLMPVIAPEGYSGDIHLLVGIDRDGELLGVRVTQHQETPGLGDRIETRKSDWIHDFRGRSLGDPPREGWRVAPDGGEFDAFSGATITPRAVVRAVRRALEVFREHRSLMLDEGPDGTNQPGAGT